MKASKWLSAALVAVLALGVLGLAGCGPNAGGSTTGETTGQGDAAQGTITIEGSDTLVNLAQAWQESYTGDNPGVTITVKGGGSGAGIAALLNGTVDFANASREVKAEEIEQAKANGIEPLQTEVAKDGIAVIVNKGNAVSALNKDQLGKIYRGEITNWKDVGGSDEAIVLLGRDTSSGTYEYFLEEVVGEDNEYAKSMRNLQNTSAIVDEVAKNPAAIGYVGVGYINESIKVVELDGTAASVEAVLAGDYVLSRGLYMVSNGEPTGAAKAYLDWILGPDGQTIVEEQGFVPLSK